MKSGQIFEVDEREFDLELELLRKENELRENMEVSEVFGRMKEKIQITINLSGLGVDDDIIAEATELSLTDIRSILGRN